MAISVTNFDSVHGYIIEPGLSDYQHFWGGQFEVLTPPQQLRKPCLLFTLDLENHRIRGFFGRKGRLPLVSFLNSAEFNGRQDYIVDTENAVVRLVSLTIYNGEELDDKDKLPDPLPRFPITLRSMNEIERAATQENFEEASEAFWGGGSFIRLFGKALLVWDVELFCSSCGQPMTYFAGIGYEGCYARGGFAGEKSFFYGEVALYYYWCGSCSLYSITSQGT